MHSPKKDLFELKELAEIQLHYSGERINQISVSLLKMSQVMNRCLDRFHREILMNFNKASAFASVIAGSALALSTAPAYAFNFTTGSSLGTCSALSGPFYTGPFDQQLSNATAGSCTTGDGFTLTASGGVLQGKLVGDTTAVGVTRPNDPSPAETNDTEAVTLTLPGTGSILKSLDFAFVYRPGVFGDEVYEVAAGITNTDLTGSLRITSPTTALWNVPELGILDQIVNAVSASNPDSGGLYRIDNPFGSSVLSSVVLKPLPGSTSAGSYIPTSQGLNSFINSDFSLGGAEATSASSVPEPATLAGLGLIGGLLVTSRRRKTS